MLTPVRRVWWLVLVSVVLLAGCKVDARVDVTLRADGSGTISATVALDADAVHQLVVHESLAKAVPLADVRAAGWIVSAWKPVPDGGDSITLTHGFVGQTDLTRRIADLAGSSGVLSNPRIGRTGGWFAAKDSIALTVDLTHLSTGIRSDAGVSKALTAAGVDVKALDAQLRSELGTALTVSATVHAPGGESKTVQLTAGKQATVSASTAKTYTKRVVLLAIGAVLLLLAVLLMGATRASTSRRRRTSSASRRR